MLKLQFKSKTWLDKDGVEKAVKEASIAPMEQAALMVEREAKRSMKAGGGGRAGERGKPSPAGRPPHTQTGTLRSSIHSDVTARGTYVIGPTSPAVYGRIHEFGGMINVTDKMRRYLHSIGIHLRSSTTKIHLPPRPFMRPALYQVLDKYVDLFDGMDLGNTTAGRVLNRARRKR